MKRLAALVVCAALSTSGSAADRQLPLADLFEKVDPSVVEIATIQEVIADKGPPKETRAGGFGSGFLISEDGLIMTASHVVQMAEDVAVRWVTGEVSKAKIVSSNPNADVALLKAESVPEPSNPLSWPIPIRFGWATRSSSSAHPGNTPTASPSETSAPAGHRTISSAVSSRWNCSRPTRPSTRATPAVPCSTWPAKSSAWSVTSSLNPAAPRDWVSS